MIRNIAIIRAGQDKIKYSVDTPPHLQLDYFIENNTESLANVYNKAIEFFINKYPRSILLFTHDDVELPDYMSLRHALNNAIEHAGIDVVGVAGATKMALQKPCLWHRMCEIENKRHMSGAVSHFTNAENEDYSSFVSSYGIWPRECVVMDGVFLAVKAETLRDTGIRFDSNNPSKFHFYDLDFCLTARKNGLRLSTWPIHITHESHGLEAMNEEFVRGQEYFYNKWNEND